MNQTTAKDRIRNTLLSGSVERYHAEPSVPSQTVAQHCWGVSVIVSQLFSCLAIGGTREVADAVTLHDQLELFTGDIPLPAKYDNPEFKDAVTEVEKLHSGKLVQTPTPGSFPVVQKTLFKLADYLEGAHWCLQWEVGDKKVLKRYIVELRRIWSVMECDILPAGYSSEPEGVQKLKHTMADLFEICTGESLYIPSKGISNEEG